MCVERVRAGGLRQQPCGAPTFRVMEFGGELAHFHTLVVCREEVLNPVTERSAQAEV